MLLTLSVTGFVSAQNQNWFYATTDIQSAQKLLENLPDQIQILDSSDVVSAVYMTEEAAMKLKENDNLHGPAYIFRKDKATAINAANHQPQPNLNVLNFVIDQDNYVNQCIAQVSEENIGNTILDMEGYGTRFHTKASGVQASHDLRDRWANMAVDAGRSDVSVEAFDHNFTDQISVILTIPGSLYPDEYVILGGHLDSGDYWIQNNAPGADDNGSGIATLTETLRVLLANDFHPLRTVQFMGYAAEEVGLFGSADIAQSYANAGKDVKAVLQLDMTNYKGSNYDIAIISDAQFTSNELNLYLVDLLEHYNSQGEHAITYGFSNCGYACSDHVSWTENGYMASFPFESAMNQDNPNVHTTNDTYAAMGNTAVHAVKFAKLALEFAIETAKTDNMKTTEVNPVELMTVVKNKELIYKLTGSTNLLSSLMIFDGSGKKLIQNQNLSSAGSISMNELPNGLYIAIFKDSKGKTFSKKFILK